MTERGYGLPRTDLLALARDFPDWRIERHEFGWALLAVLRRGTFTHVLAAHGLDDLRAKIEKATAEGRSTSN